MIRIAIVDDHAIVRAGLRQFFADQPDFAVVAEAANGRDALAIVRAGEIDVMVLDISMPEQNGVDTLAAIKLRAPELPVLILSGFPEAHYATTLLRQGGSGKSTTWGVIASNTPLDRQAVQGQMHANEAGGLSGGPVLAKSNAVIRQLRDQLGAGFPIIGVGGILSGADAVAKVKAGADVVQIYTGLIYRGPGLITEVAQALQASGR